MFVGFAIICDDYFVPSLEIMCDGMYTFCCILYNTDVVSSNLDQGEVCNIM
jgi:hypothetical protein